MKIVTEEEYRLALEKWKEENPDKEYSDVPVKTVIEINGKTINLGTRISYMRQYPYKLSEEIRNYWEKKGILNRKIERPTEEEYRLALEKWKEEHPDKKYTDIPQSAVIEINGKQISIGNRIRNIKHEKVQLSNKDIAYYCEKGILASNHIKEEEYHLALEKWKSENPDKEYQDIPFTTIVEINGKQISIGERILKLKTGSIALNPKQKSYWQEKGILEKANLTIAEEEYCQALEKWKQENHDKEYQDIPSTTVVELNGKTIHLGMRITKMRCGDYQLTEEMKKYWGEKGLLTRKNKCPSKEEYRLALEKWKQENPDKEYSDIPVKAVVEINGKTISIGRRISSMRNGCIQLTEEEKKYWGEKGLLTRKNEHQPEELYRLALEKWKAENPDKKYQNITQNTVVEINGKTIRIGKRISAIRNGFIKLNEEQRNYWQKKGIVIQKNSRPTEEEYRLALEKWKSENPDKEYQDLPSTVIVELNGKQIHLGARISAVKGGNIHLTQDQKKYWEDKGVLKRKKERPTEEEYRLALEKWKKEHPNKKYTDIPQSTVVEINGKSIYIGRRVDKIKKGKIKLPQDQKKYWEEKCLFGMTDQGEKNNSSWSEEKYVKQMEVILEQLGLDSKEILKEMDKDIISLEEAIANQTFSQIDEKKQPEWIKELYIGLIKRIKVECSEEQFITEVANMCIDLKKEFLLSELEIQFIKEKAIRYFKLMKQYQILEVGLEINEREKRSKIRRYNLDAEEIEESYLIPLEFENGMPLETKSKMYLRGQLLRQYIIDWDYYSDQEKKTAIEKWTFTDEEVNCINATRNKINGMMKKLNIR